jgi:hypothetical protein
MPQTPRDLADRMAARRRLAKADDGYARETFTQPRDQARRTARTFLDRWPTAAYMSRSRELARAARWRDRVHDEAAAKRGLIIEPGIFGRLRWG